ncbi:methylmalonyl Co-A mutase-associated GTPase MeaB [bacterium]|nr:methylmalonyl Co-A mutase-associated GTPase MeaB [bacterium]
MALSRLITRVENRVPGWIDAMQKIYPLTGSARLVGITGSPGSGKSTLTGQIAHLLVAKQKKVGIIAVDPSSPFSGGAILGDRVRMTGVSDLSDVFVRSMATRGALGGLNQSVRDVAKIMDAFGKDYILIETVGVGQDEVEVVRTADLVIVVCIPGQGDSIQAIKAGVMEIADLFVVNKADIDGADQVAADIQWMLELGMKKEKPPIVETIATKGEGINTVVEKTMELLQHQNRSDSWLDERVREELVGLASKEIVDIIKENWIQNNELNLAIRQIREGKNNPYSVVKKYLASLSLVNVFEQQSLLDH